LHNGPAHRVERLPQPDGTGWILKTSVGVGLGAAERLENERRILQRLQGAEGCPRLIDTEGPPRSLLMADFGGVRLDASDLMGALDLAAFLQLAKTLARAVAGVHARGIVHRAIEPAHILVRPDELTVELIGFSTATTFVEEPSALGGTARLPRNPLWIAPEQTGLMNRAVDWRADLYSLGAVLYALATGKAPFTEESAEKILHAHMARLPDPPSAAAPWIPKILERILLKLLAKEPDERPQGPASLARNFALLHQAHAGGRPLEEIPLPPEDIPARPRPPSRLHGRSEEFERLAGAFERVTNGGARQVFVAGRPGTGKSSLIQELSRSVALSGGFFTVGKCEQFGQGNPFHAPARALEGLGRLLQKGSPSARDKLGKRLAMGLGAEAPVLCAMAPALEPLLGPPARLEQADDHSTRARLVEPVVDFLETICSPEHPVVWVLDDLQWADTPTLRLVKRLLGNTRLEGFLLVGAYRDDETGPSHPLSLLLRDRDSQGRTRERIDLGHLDEAAVASMLGEMLGTRQSDLPKLAKLLMAKTGGNPFFTAEMVELLWREGTLLPNDSGASWQWKAVAIRGGGTTSNVAKLLARDLGTLPRSTRDILGDMACLGSGCDLATLGLATSMETRQVAGLLEPALGRGVLTTSDVSAFQTRNPEARLRFAHDHIQHAALDLRSPEKLTRRRLAIARRLSSPASQPDLEAKAAWCYSHALDLLEGAEERATARGVLRRSAEAALASGDHTTAESHLRQARSLLPADAVETDRGEVFQILAGLHLACYHRGGHAEGDEFFELLGKLATSPEELALPTCIQVMSLSNRTQYSEAVRLGGALAEKLLGQAMPLANPEPALRAEMEAFRKLAGEGGLERLMDRMAPVDSGWTHAARLLNRMIPAAFFTSPPLACWLALRCGREWIENGYRPAFLYPMACTGLAFMGLDGDYATGWQAASQALGIGRSRGAGVETARSEHVFGLFSCHWFEPLENALAHARSAFEVLSRTDELEFACYTFFTSQAAVFELAGNLEDMRREVAAALDYSVRTGNLHATQSFAAFHQTVRALEGGTASPGSFDEDSFREEKHLAEIAENPMARAFFHTYRAFTACLFHDLEAMDRHAGEAAALTPYITGFYPVALAKFLHALALAERLRTGRGTESTESELVENQRWLAERAADQPANFATLRDIVEAERLDAAGNPMGAFAMFEKACREAQPRQRPWQLAIAAERAARCFERHGLEMASRPLFAEALALHLQLGARGKVDALVAERPYLKSVPAVSVPSQSPLSDAGPRLALAIKSLSSQQTVKELAASAAPWFAELTGATDVRIVALDFEERWMLKAALSNGNPLPAMPRAEAVQAGLLSETVLRLCEESPELLLFNDTAADERLEGDPYFIKLPACSLLAMPVFAHSKLRAIVVLENRLLRSAFDSGLIENARILCDQLALGIGNIRGRQSLERLVAQRTEELQAARQREKTLARTAYELTENIPVGTFVQEFDADGTHRFLFVSERWLQMLDLKRDEVMAGSAPAFHTLHPEDRASFERALAGSFEKKARLDWEGRLMVRGKTMWVTIEAIPRQRGGSTLWEGVTIDISDLKEAERREREIAEAHRLELRQKLKTALVASAISHEIKQPLSRMIHTADLLGLDAAEALAKQPRFAELVRELSSDARLTNEIIQKMGNLLRNVKTAHRRFDLGECVSNAVLANTAKWRQAGVDIVLEEPQGAFPIEGDETQIALALGNLFDNAAQAMAAHPGPLAPEILVQLLPHPREFEIRIGDSGPGIPEADIADLLLRSTKAEGTGLGLFIVQTTLENHGGRLEIGRSPLGGAEFRMVFPKSAE
jgi:PAS domain S-box-containing protein